MHLVNRSLYQSKTRESEIRFMSIFNAIYSFDIFITRLDFASTTDQIYYFLSLTFLHLLLFRIKIMISRLNRTLVLSTKCLFTNQFRSISSAQHHRPLMLMDIPHQAYPNAFLMIRNLFSRLIISTYFDSTFAMDSFSNGARQALTVVSQLIANEQFDDLQDFVTREVETISKNKDLFSINEKII